VFPRDKAPNIDAVKLIPSRPDIDWESGGRDWDRTSDPCDVNAVASPEARTNPCDLAECFPVSFSLGSRQPGANLGRKRLVRVSLPEVLSHVKCPECGLDHAW